MMFPICCVTDVPAETINEFLKATYDKNDTKWKNSALHGERYLVVVDRLNAEVFTEPTVPPVREFSSPFKGKTPEECLQLIQEEAERPGSEIDTTCFVILDERTLTDSTILIAGEGMDGELLSFRATFAGAQGNLLALSVLKPPIDDVIYYAELEDDNVLKD